MNAKIHYIYIEFVCSKMQKHNVYLEKFYFILKKLIFFSTFTFLSLNLFHISTKAQERNKLESFNIAVIGKTIWGDNKITVTGHAAGNSPDTVQIVSDGNQESIFSYCDYTTPIGTTAYAQKIDDNGHPEWGANGVELSSSGRMHDKIKSVSDGSGGAIFTWGEKIGSSWFIFTQKINSEGILQWGAQGVRITTVTSAFPEITTDGTGGAIIAWEDFRGANTDIYTQKIDSNGNVSWAANGVLINNNTGLTISEWLDIQLAEDGSGGAVITWTDYRNGGFGGNNWEVYAQRINSSGIVQWAANGIAVGSAANNQYDPYLANVGSNNVIITWRDMRSGTTRIYAQKLNSSGNAQWTANGKNICCSINSQAPEQIIHDESGGAIIVWGETRVANGDIIATRIDGSGNNLWSTNGEIICSAAASQDDPRMASDTNGGAFVTWEDPRDGNDDIYAQHIDSSGTTLWTDNGIEVTTELGDQYAPNIAYIGSYRAIIGWEDTEVYARGVETLFQIESLPANLDVEKLNTENIESGSEYGSNLTSEYVYLIIQDINYIAALVPVDMTSMRNWPNVNAEADLSNTKSLVENLSSAEGTADTFTLYVPRDTNHNAVYVCPNATSLSEISLSCTGGFRLINGQTSNGITAVATTVSGRSVWSVSGVNGTGGVSYEDSSLDYIPDELPETYSIGIHSSFFFVLSLFLIFSGVFIFQALLYFSPRINTY